jgi:hypothetical protein
MTKKEKDPFPEGPNRRKNKEDIENIQNNFSHPHNGNKQTKSDDEFITIPKTRFNLKSNYYDQIHDVYHDGDKRIVINQFVKYNGNSKPTFAKQVETYDDEGNRIVIIPSPQIGSRKLDKIFENDEVDFIKFPPPPIAYESEFYLFNKIKEFIHKFVEVKEEDELLLSLWIMKAVLFDTLKNTSFPMIHVIGPYGKGKSRLLSVMTSITPYGCYLINISSAPLKRISEIYSPILYVDEKGDMDNDLVALLNSKFNRNSIYLNADQKIQRGPSALIGYKLYGPIALAGRTPFRDDAIESKSFQINLNFDMSRKDIPRKIKGRALDEFESEAKQIRGELLQFRINWRDKINDIEPSDFLSRYKDHLEPRLFEIISFFEDLIEIIPELKPELSRVLEYQIKRNVEVAKETPNGIIASTLLSILENPEENEMNEIKYSIGGKEYEGIYLAAIYEEVGINYAKQTGKILSALGLKTDRPRVTIEGKDGEKDKNKRVSVVRIPEEDKLNELRSRYDPEYVNTVLSRISQTPQTSLDDEDYEDDEMGDRVKENKTDKENDLKVLSPLNDSPHSPLRPSDNLNNSQEPEESIVQNDFSKEQGFDPHLAKMTSPLNDSPHSPLRPSDNLNNSQEPEESIVQSKDWQYFRVKESFTFGKYTYQKGKVSKFPVLEAGIYIEKGLLELPCAHGQVWDPNEKQCIENGGGQE